MCVPCNFKSSFTYNDRGRLVSANAATYVYDGLGQRVKKVGPTAIVPSGTNYFVYDESGKLLGEYDASGAVINEYAYLDDELIAVMRGPAAATEVFNVYADQVGRPWVITDATDQLRWRWDTSPFGEFAPNDNPAGLGAFTFNVRFPGQYYDAESGRFYNYFRDYDPQTGRYVQSDPVGLQGGINTYAYVGGNPLSYSDPEGKWIVGAVGAGVGAITGGLGSVAAQLMQNQGNWGCVDWKNVGSSALTGGLTGLALTTPLGTTWTGIAGIGAVGNTANYAITNSPQSYSAGGFGAAAVSGLAGGVIGGRTPNPYWFTQVSPTLNDLRLAAQLVSAKSFTTNFLGATVGAYEFPKGPPGSNDCTCSSK